jgi:hypothetical protein
VCKYVLDHDAHAALYPLLLLSGLLLEHGPAFDLTCLIIEAPLHPAALEYLALYVAELIQVLPQNVFVTENVILWIPERLIEGQEGEDT